MQRTEREFHKQAWLESGKTKKAYCELAGIKYPTFMSWFKKEGGLGSFKKIVSRADQLEGIEILFPNGIRLYSRQQINVDFLKMLQSA